MPEKSDLFVAERRKLVDRCNRFGELHFDIEDIEEDEASDESAPELEADYQHFLAIRQYAKNMVTDTAAVLSQADPEKYCY